MSTLKRVSAKGTAYDIGDGVLQTPVTIDGVSFDGSANITHYGVCSTAAGTAAKTVSIAGFVLAAGAKVTVKFVEANTAASPTLNVSSTGAKTIAVTGSAVATAGQWTAGSVLSLTYDGTRWVINDVFASAAPTLSYSIATSLEPASQGEIDYNDFTIPGNWKVTSGANAGLITNCPEAVAHRLFVIAMTQANRVVQIVITNSSSSGLYMRFGSGSSWGSWNKFALQSSVDTRPALAYGDATTLAPVNQGDYDYNDFTTPGNWKVTSSSDAGKISNCPTGLAHRLFVVTTTATERVAQIVLANAKKAGLYVRFYDGSWGEWNKVATNNDLVNLPYAVYANETELVTIPTVDGGGNPTDYDNYVDEGCFQVGSSASAKKMVNCPATVAHRMYVSRLYSGSSQIFQTILCADKAMTKFVRRGRAKQVPIDPDDPESPTTQVVTWQDWAVYRSQEEDHFPVYNQFNSTFPRNVGRIKFGGVAVAGTLPYQGNVKWQTDYYTEEDDIGGVLYSSVWRDGLDVFRNLTLETFYSALANPYSVLYTKDYTDKGYRNAHAWYGGVCSTYVSAAMGFPLYKTTGQLETYLTPKEMQSVRDIELGDILLNPGDEDSGGHIAFISNTYVDGDGALNGVCVSEETTPVFRTTVVDINDLDAYIKNRHYTVMVPATQIENYPVLDNPVFNKEIIFERGNNTYITQAELTAAGAKALFYVPNGTAETVITFTKDSVEGVSFTLGSVPKESDIPVYNFISKMQDAARYEFNISGNTGKPCAVTVINPGTIQVSNTGVMDLSGWDGCVPCAYYIVSEFASNTITGRGYDPTPGVPPGYSDDYQWVCSYTGNADIIDVAEGAVGATVQIPAAYIAGLNRWKVWLEYDTGCGLKQVFSGIVEA